MSSLGGDGTIHRLQDYVEAKPHVYAYIVLAKAGLWLTSAVLVLVVVLSLLRLLASGVTTDQLSVIVAACQVLSLVAVTVLGYHGYKGGHMLHTLRHWTDKP